jgi:hypothetical protein
MGLNYSYVLVVAPAAEPRLDAYLRQAGSVEQLSKPYTGTCLTLDFPLDEALLAYLREDIQRSPDPARSSWARFRKSDYRQHFPTDDTGRVGCLYLDSALDPVSGQLFVEFTAATSRMSRMLQDSSSIRRWFLDLSAELGATATFLHLEADGYRFIDLHGQETAAAVDEDLRVQTATAAERDAVLGLCWGYDTLFLNS